ncbi:MAG: hypothetical protein NT139_00665 [Candidatus Woesearchaeota archaeon]|nr:hypothetical protein [Candidatus Woesearchaeota archaeon]
MKHLFFVRHGNYDYDNKGFHLSLKGKTEMETLSKLIKEIACPKFYIISSPEIVAIESAKVLAEKLGLDSIEESFELWPQKATCHGDPEIVNDLLNSKKDKGDSLILISHLELSDKYPTYFLRNELKINDYIPPIIKGKAVHFNLETKLYQILPK